MRTLLSILTLATLATSCGTPKLTNTGEPTATTRYNSGASPQINKPNSVDTVAVTGTEYLQVLGRNENGMFPSLEGSWVLQSMPAGNLSSNPNNLIKEAEANLNQDRKQLPGKVLSQQTQESKEVKRDANSTITTTTSSSTSTVYSVNSQDSMRRITPQQGSSLHVPQKPSINLFGSNETFSGFTGCNKIAGRYTLGADNSITFRHSAPSTRMVCIGDYDETVFINTLKRVNKYKSNGSELKLLEGDNLLFVFARK